LALETLLSHLCKVTVQVYIVCDSKYIVEHNNIRKCIFRIMRLTMGTHAPNIYENNRENFCDFETVW
jgi:hypothetical protein